MNRLRAFQCFGPSPPQPFSTPRAFAWVSGPSASARERLRLNWGNAKQRSQTWRRRKWNNAPRDRARYARLTGALQTSAYDCADVCWGQRRASFTEATEAALCFVWFRCISFFLVTWELLMLAHAAPGGYCHRAHAYQETDVSMRGGVCESGRALVRAHAERKSNIVVISTNAPGLKCNPLNLLLPLRSNRIGSKVRAIVSLTRGYDIWTCKHGMYLTRGERWPLLEDLFRTLGWFLSFHNFHFLQKKI